MCLVPPSVETLFEKFTVFLIVQGVLEGCIYLVQEDKIYAMCCQSIYERLDNVLIVQNMLE